VIQHWAGYSLLMGALPYLFTVAVQVVENPQANPLENSPELWFLSLAMCAGALGEIFKDHGAAPRPRRRRDRFRIFVLFVLVFGVAISGIAYSWYVHGDRGAPGRDLGVDCAFVIKHLADPRDRIHDLEVDRWVHRWGPDCGEWHAQQTRLFGLSLRMVIFFGLASTIAVGLYAPKGGS
jgi:hypothetical protein